MPNGRYHTNATLIVATEYLLASAISLDPSNVQYVAGALLGVILHPDLDVDHGKVSSNRLIRERLGLTTHYVWSALWYVYRKSLRHGGKLSHFPVISTLGRLAYLYMFAIVLPYLVIAPVLHLDIWFELSWWAWVPITHYKVILGLMTTDFFHWLLDIAITDHKRRAYS